MEGNISREFTFSGIISCHQNTKTIISISNDPLLNIFSSKSHISTLNTINIAVSINFTSMLMYQKTLVAAKMKIKIELLESVVVKVVQNFNNITFSERGLILDQIFKFFHQILTRILTKNGPLSIKIGILSLKTFHFQ